MKILYGVQATGNGHITRARTMAPELARAGIEVDYLFSGRTPDKLFNMETFGDYRCLPGLSFATADGEVKYLRTLFCNNVYKFMRDTLTLDLGPYDLVLTDFEPVTAWAARFRHKPCIGIGHQYAFRYPVPVAGSNPLARLVLKSFAPAQRSLGLHWHHFNNPILPPMIEATDIHADYIDNKILVYLPFDGMTDMLNWLRPMGDFEFFIYCDIDKPHDENHLHLRPFSRHGFLADLRDASGVISNAGFELMSESIQYGKKILVKPLQGQMEQISNGRALQELGYGEVINNYDHRKLRNWLQKAKPLPRPYPDVAAAIVNWLKTGMRENEHDLSRLLWAQNDQAGTL